MLSVLAGNGRIGPTLYSKTLIVINSNQFMRTEILSLKLPYKS